MQPPSPSPGSRAAGIAAGWLLAGLLPAGFAEVRAAPANWRFDPVHSQVWFEADHQGFSRALGRLRIKDGWFRFDPDDWSSAAVDVTLDLAGADLGDAKWNEAIRSAPWLDVGRHPVARYASRSVEARDARSGVIHGELTLRGVVRPVDVEFTLNRIGDDPYAFGRKAGFSARAVLQRSTFGMQRFDAVVGEDIVIRIEIEGLRLQREKPHAAAK